jgi:hypothetical protein
MPRSFSIQIIDHAFCIQTEHSVLTYNSINDVRVEFENQIRLMLMDELHSQLESGTMDSTLTGILSEVILEKL